MKDSSEILLKVIQQLEEVREELAKISENLKKDDVLDEYSCNIIKYDLGDCLQSQIQELHSIAQNSPGWSKEDKPDFNEFLKDFKAFYYKDRKRQEAKGMAIFKLESFYQKMIKEYPKYRYWAEDFFCILEEEGHIFVVEDCGEKVFELNQ
jgi:hypothetical protein